MFGKEFSWSVHLRHTKQQKWETARTKWRDLQRISYGNFSGKLVLKTFFFLVRRKILIYLVQINIVHFVIILLQHCCIIRLSNMMVGYTHTHTHTHTHSTCKRNMGVNVFRIVTAVQPDLPSSCTQLGPVHLALTRSYRMRTECSYRLKTVILDVFLCSKHVANKFHNKGEFHLRTGCEVPRVWGQVELYSFFNLGARWGG